MRLFGIEICRPPAVRKFRECARRCRLVRSSDRLAPGDTTGAALLWLLAFGLMLTVAHRLVRDGWWAPSWAGAYEAWWERVVERRLAGAKAGRARVATSERVELVPLSEEVVRWEE